MVYKRNKKSNKPYDLLFAKTLRSRIPIDANKATQIEKKLRNDLQFNWVSLGWQYLRVHASAAAAENHGN